MYRKWCMSFCARYPIILPISELASIIYLNTYSNAHIGAPQSNKYLTLLGFASTPKIGKQQRSLLRSLITTLLRSLITTLFRSLLSSLIKKNYSSPDADAYPSSALATTTICLTFLKTCGSLFLR
jgi:hypothetical protein